LFEACGSFQEFEEFLRSYDSHPEMNLIQAQWHEILKKTPVVAKRPVASVLPVF